MKHPLVEPSQAIYKARGLFVRKAKKHLVPAKKERGKKKVGPNINSVNFCYCWYK